MSVHFFGVCGTSRKEFDVQLMGLSSFRQRVKNAQIKDKPELELLRLININTARSTMNLIKARRRFLDHNGQRRTHTMQIAFLLVRV
jgi:2'-5' RNA ligase